MSPSDSAARRISGSTRADSQSRRNSTTRQLITFVDSQDPNSRSAIQRHTAHHSNAQRRDAWLHPLENLYRSRSMFLFQKFKLFGVYKTWKPINSQLRSTIWDLRPNYCNLFLLEDYKIRLFWEWKSLAGNMLEHYVPQHKPWIAKRIGINNFLKFIKIKALNEVL